MKQMTLREWAEYYHSSNLAVLPSTVWSKEAMVECMRGEQTQSELQKFNWEDSESISGIIGISDIIVLELNFEFGDSAFMYRVVSKCLEYLNLPAYPWVIYSYCSYEEVISEKVQIIIQCSAKAVGRQGYEPISILWSGFYDLPFITKNKVSSTNFYFQALPLISPKKVDYKGILDAVAKLVDEFGLFLNKKESTP